MKMRFALYLVGLAIGFTVPTFAQQTVDPKIAQQIRVFAAKYDEAYNRNDAAAVAALYTEDGVYITSSHGTFHGRQAIEKDYAKHSFQDYPSKNMFTNVDRVIAVGNDVRVIGRWSDTFQQQGGGTMQADGRFSWVLLREGDTWKIRRDSHDITNRRQS
jgi:uncharacterized protein (TIGR02246 family)